MAKRENKLSLNPQTSLSIAEQNGSDSFLEKRESGRLSETPVLRECIPKIGSDRAERLLLHAPRIASEIWKDA